MPASKCRSRSIGSSSLPPQGTKFVKAHIAELGTAEPQITESEGETIRIELREKPGGITVGGEEFDDGLEVEGLVLSVDRSALSP